MENDQVGLIPIHELRLWEGNYRKGDVRRIAQSILRFGFNGALRVWNGEVMAGNHALMAIRSIRESGAPPPKGVWERAGVWFAPCIDISHLSREESIAFGIADNALQERGSSDALQLSKLLSELQSKDAELMEDSGFCQGDLDRLIASLAEEDPSIEPASESEQGELDKSCARRCEQCGKRLAD